MSDTRPLTKVQQRLLNEILAYRDGMPNETAATASEGHRNETSCGERVFPYAGPRGRRSWLERVSVAAVALAAVALAATLLVQVVSGSGSRVLAATPPPLSYHLDPAQSGRAVLLHLAAVAARQPVPSPPASGPYAYVKYAGWYLAVRVSGSTVSSAIVPSVTESWIRADGHGRVIRRRAKADGARVTATNDGPIFEDFSLPAGVGRAYPLLRLSTDPAVVARQLNAGDPPKWREPAERFDWLTNLNLEQPVPPDVESTILRVLATSPGLINSGTVVDRVGRPGVAVSLDSGHPPDVPGVLERYTLILSPSTGRLLGEEETLIGNPRKLPVRRGAVLDYTVFLTSGYVNRVPNHG
jgi:hypothetical protein